jgi:hypothetical protein
MKTGFFGLLVLRGKGLWLTALWAAVRTGAERPGFSGGFFPGALTEAGLFDARGESPTSFLRPLAGIEAFIVTPLNGRKTRFKKNFRLIYHNKNQDLVIQYGSESRN